MGAGPHRERTAEALAFARLSHAATALCRVLGKRSSSWTATKRANPTCGG